MPELCDKTGRSYYKPTMVEPVFEKELEHKPCPFLFPLAESRRFLLLVRNSVSLFFQMPACLIISAVIAAAAAATAALT